MNEVDPFNCFYSTIHEVGHAAYEQGVDAAYLLTPIGQGASMGVHESQSRSYENQLGRSRAFTGWLYRRMREVFGDFGIADGEAFYRAVNRVRPSLIRVEADELTYNFHIMLRVEIEMALIEGSLKVADLPEAWAAAMQSTLGLTPPDDARGALQDIHWSSGLFGSFCTYTVGNVMSAQFFAAAKRALPGMDDHLAAGSLVVGKGVAQGVVDFVEGQVSVDCQAVAVIP